MKRSLLTQAFVALVAVAVILTFDVDLSHAAALSAVPFMAIGMTAMNASQVRVVDPILTTVAQGYKPQNLIGRRILPVVPVDISGGQILSFGKEAFMNYNLRRAPGAATKRIQFGYLGLPFALVQDAGEVVVPREWMRDASVIPGINLGTRAVNLGMSVTSKSLEADIAALVLNTSNVPNNTALSGSAKWSNNASDPVADIEGAKETVRTSIGVRPNLGTYSAVAWKAFRNNANVRDRFKYTSDKPVSLEMAADLLELEEVQVGDAVSSDDAGTFTDIWGNNMLLSYSPKDPTGPEQPAFGYTYTMAGHPMIETPYWDPNAKSWIFPATYERKPVIAGSAGAYLFQNPN